MGKARGGGVDEIQAHVTLDSKLLAQEVPLEDGRVLAAYDLAAYDKRDYTTAMQRNVMQRIFGAFDVHMKGEIDSSQLDALLKYLGLNPDVSRVDPIFPEVEEGGVLSFTRFWKWWIHQDRDQSEAAYELASAPFKVPFVQQQLVLKESGVKYTASYRISYMFVNTETGETVSASPWHDIPLYVHELVRSIPSHIPSNCFNFICEIPKWTRAKFEIATHESLNPICQDMKLGLPRFYHHGDMMWNYGAFPQTWESSEVLFAGRYRGDRDPIDAVEIGMRACDLGSVTHVKVLGALGLIDDDEMDWKIICISCDDPIAQFLNDIDDVPRHLPGCLGAIREWFRTYKIVQGGEENKFIHDGEFQTKQTTLKIIDDSNRMWAKLRKVGKKSEL